MLSHANNMNMYVFVCLFANLFGCLYALRFNDTLTIKHTHRTPEHCAPNIPNTAQ